MKRSYFGAVLGHGRRQQGERQVGLDHARVRDSADGGQSRERILEVGEARFQHLLLGADEVQIRHDQVHHLLHPRRACGRATDSALLKHRLPLPIFTVQLLNFWPNLRLSWSHFATEQNHVRAYAAQCIIVCAYVKNTLHLFQWKWTICTFYMCIVWYILLGKSVQIGLEFGWGEGQIGRKTFDPYRNKPIATTGAW